MISSWGRAFQGDRLWKIRWEDNRVWFSDNGLSGHLLLNSLLAGVVMLILWCCIDCRSPAGTSERDGGSPRERSPTESRTTAPDTHHRSVHPSRIPGPELMVYPRYKLVHLYRNVACVSLCRWHLQNYSLRNMHLQNYSLHYAHLQNWITVYFKA